MSSFSYRICIQHLLCPRSSGADLKTVIKVAVVLAKVRVRDERATITPTSQLPTW